MAVSDSEMVAAWNTVLKLSKVGPGQIVTILTNPTSHPQTLQTAVLAANALGAIVNRLDLPAMNAERSLSRDKLAYVGKTPLSGNTAAIAALKASDIVIDLMVLLFSPEQIEIMQSGTRILLAPEPPEVLVRMVPTSIEPSCSAKWARPIATSSRMGSSAKSSSLSNDDRRPSGIT